MEYCALNDELYDEVFGTFRYFPLNRDFFYFNDAYGARGHDVHDAHDGHDDHDAYDPHDGDFRDENHGHGVNDEHGVFLRVSPFHENECLALED